MLYPRVRHGHTQPCANAHTHTQVLKKTPCQIVPSQTHTHSHAQITAAYIQQLSYTQEWTFRCRQACIQIHTIVRFKLCTICRPFADMHSHTRSGQTSHLLRYCIHDVLFMQPFISTLNQKIVWPCLVSFLMIITSESMTCIAAE